MENVGTALRYILWLFSLVYGRLVYFMASCSILCRSIWYILWPFGIFYGHLEYFMAIWYILWPLGIFYGHLPSIFCGHLVYLFPFRYIMDTKKNLASLLYSSFLAHQLAYQAVCNCSSDRGVESLHSVPLGESLGTC
jgi:hypothetical protein